MTKNVNVSPSEQVVSKPQFRFLESPIYSKSAVLVWDPSAYNATLQQWYNHPDWPFFEQFFSKRLMAPEDSLFLLQVGFSYGRLGVSKLETYFKLF